MDLDCRLPDNFDDLIDNLPESNEELSDSNSEELVLFPVFPQTEGPFLPTQPAQRNEYQKINVCSRPSETILKIVSNDFAAAVNISADLMNKLKENPLPIISNFDEYFVAMSLSDDLRLISKFVLDCYSAISNNLDSLLWQIRMCPHHKLRPKHCTMLSFLAAAFSKFEPKSNKARKCLIIQEQITIEFANNVLSGAFEDKIRNCELFISPEISLTLVIANMQHCVGESCNKYNVRFFNISHRHTEEAKIKLEMMVGNTGSIMIDQIYNVRVRLVDYAEFSVFGKYTIMGL
ncbi:hypothetical protein BNJ_00312 [Kaumoebavirus]|uniref:hypothetical protein n=1 Tax=Kaumoebavirus TaxID=1859492 RepID=UPI0009C386E9|nr:hypothetical protein BNJ_00312 [Kaumoebavirus]ARA72134.1 hypothetical protein BNJ_00312 [Kaumoebavirus]